jgi:glucokinase
MTRGASIGVDLGATKVAASLVSADYSLLASYRWPQTPADYNQAIDSVASLVANLTEDARSQDIFVTGVGVAVAAFLNADRSEVLHAANLDWRHKPLRADLEARVGRDITVANDADAAAWGEYLAGEHRAPANLLVVTLGTGLGCGIVVNGQLLTGSSGLGGEIGHLQVAPDGRQCPCGGRGCLEQYVSGSALVRSARDRAAADPDSARCLLNLVGADSSRIDGQAVTRAALDGDQAAIAAFDEVGGWLGFGIAHAVGILDPDAVLLGGGLASTGDLILRPTRRSYAEHVGIPSLRESRLIQIASLGAAAGAIGAALLAVNRSVSVGAARA